ncbi:MAG: hypothetical protein Q8N04_19870 [Nitrospira sp.]|nr:hypothetical protein [Nitrospira sp.]
MIIGLLVLAGVSLLGAGRAFSQERTIQASPAMTMGILQGILNETVGDLRGESGQWRFTYAGVEMALLASLPHDRMRIVAPIGPEAQLTDQQRKRMLDANFHSALDVRYATSNGLVYAAYIHPLSPLRREEVQSALRQVAELVKTFGSTYSSGELSFGQARPSAPRAPRTQQSPVY